MTASPGPSAASKSSLRRVVLASFVGTTIEWYDFFLYGTAAALVFNRLFFPHQDPFLGTLSAFGTFAIGFVARPLGGAVFGHYGDRVGRKAMLVYSLILMGVATAVIGILPTYASIGIWAPVLLTLVRFVQGIGIGGEWAGAVLMAVEHSGGKRRGFHGSWPQMGVPAGLLLSTGVFAFFSTTLSDSEFLSWGWRVPFLLSTVLIGVGLFVRLRLLETPSFARLKESKTDTRRPLVDVFREHPREIVLGIGMRFGQNIIFYLYTVFVLNYGENTLGFSRSNMLGGLAISAACGFISIPLWAHLSDRFGRRPLYLAGALFSLAFALPFFWLMEQGSVGLVWLGMILGLNVGHDLMYGPQAAYLSELFGTRVRYSGASLVSQVGSVFSGGLAPFIALLLMRAYGIEAVAAYMIGACALTLLATWYAPETHRSDLG